KKMSILLFTSGTTGTSKGVMLSHANMICSVNAATASTQYTKNDTFVSVLPIHHTYELSTGQFGASVQGATTYISEGLRYVTRNFKEYKPTGLVLVPLFLETVHKKIWDEIRRKGLEKKVRAGMAFSDSMLRMGVDLRPKLFAEVTAAFGGNLRSIVVGGAPIDPKIVRDFYSLGITVIQGYGITECSPLIAVNRPDKVKFDSVGQVVQDCEVKLAPLEDGNSKEGEILVRGGNVMLGYSKNEEATRAAFTSDGWFRTGDVGTIDREGFIRITGRIKNIIIASNGKNVFPEEIEEHLLKIPAVKECVVVGREESGNVTITAIIVPNLDVLGESSSDTAISFVLKEAITQINKTLPPYKHINKFEIRHEDFERTLSKKIKRFLVK
ncbi:MAG: AMP-binding protein, partial [Clostridia bacterium]|nr:AMP-binding protein [Clostridia bacterium]